MLPGLALQSRLGGRTRDVFTKRLEQWQVPAACPGPATRLHVQHGKIISELEGCQLVQETAFANPGWARDQHQHWSSRRQCIGQVLAEQRQLALAADQRRASDPSAKGCRRALGTSRHAHCPRDGNPSRKVVAAWGHNDVPWTCTWCATESPTTRTRRGGPDDRDRPLTSDGEKRFRRAARGLAAAGAAGRRQCSAARTAAPGAPRSCSLRKRSGRSPRRVRRSKPVARRPAYCWPCSPVPARPPRRWSDTSRACTSCCRTC